MIAGGFVALVLPLATALSAGARAPSLSRVVAHARAVPSARSRVVCMADDDIVDGGDLDIMIWIECPNTKRSIRCYMESSAELNGNRYALAHPVDIPVIIATTEDEAEGLHAIEADDEIDALFDIAKGALAEEGFELKRTPFMLTVEEDSEEFDLDDIDNEGDAADDFDEDEDEDEELDFDELSDGAEVSAPAHPASARRRAASCPRARILASNECCSPTARRACARCPRRGRC